MIFFIFSSCGNIWKKSLGILGKGIGDMDNCSHFYDDNCGGELKK